MYMEKTVFLMAIPDNFPRSSFLFRIGVYNPFSDIMEASYEP